MKQIHFFMEGGGGGRGEGVQLLRVKIKFITKAFVVYLLRIKIFFCVSLFNRIMSKDFKKYTNLM